MGTERGAIRRRPGPVLLTVPLLLAVAGCHGDPSGPSSDILELVEAGPTLQFAPPSHPTPEPLRVQVRRLQDLAPRSGEQVAWRVVEGTGAVLDQSLTSTDSTGTASVGFTLGSATGRYRVEASLLKGGTTPLDFELWAVDPPQLTDVPAAPVAAGDLITLHGANFSPVAAHDVVLFDGVRGRVVAATAGSLQVEVPACLPSRTVAVTVSLGSIASPAREVEVSAGGDVLDVPVGGSLTLSGSAAEACARLPAGVYLAVAWSAGTVAGARTGIRVVSLSDGTPATVPPGASPLSAAAPPAPPATAQERWDLALRRRERELLSDRPTAPLPAPLAQAPAAAPPPVGSQRSFKVVAPGGGFDEVRAVARYVGEHVVLYEDTAAAPDALGPADFQSLAGDFDNLIYPVDTGVYGQPSDLDGNGRVVVLLTPRVNRLTERGSPDGFIGGFFYGLDLLPGKSGSNDGEIFYTLVPDPEGRFGDARPRDKVLSVLPAILAHEFQHMIGFNQRILLRSAEGPEAVWLSEALAMMAEDLVGREAEARKDPKAQLYETGNTSRARHYLEASDSTSLIIASGSGSLAERGAEWLFLRYLEEQYGGVDLLKGLTQTTRTGIANVEAVTGQPWSDLLGAWGVALFDGGQPGLVDPELADPRYRYPELRLRTLLSATGTFPLTLHRLGPGDETLAGSLLPASPLHAALIPAAGEPVTVGLGGGDGGVTSASAAVYLLVVRLR